MRKTTMTRTEQAARRERIARMVEAGRTLGQTARHFGVSLELVRQVCRIFDVDYPGRRNRVA